MADFFKSSITSNTYSFKMTNAYSGYQVYCVVTDAYGNEVKSNTVTLRSKATITKQPANVSTAIGTTAKATVTATGNGLKYQWYYKKPEMTSFAKSSITSNTYSFKMTNAYSGYQAYCIVTDAYGNEVKSNTVTFKAV